MGSGRPGLLRSDGSDVLRSPTGYARRFLVDQEVCMCSGQVHFPFSLWCAGFPQTVWGPMTDSHCGAFTQELIAPSNRAASIRRRSLRKFIDVHRTISLDAVNL